MLWYRVATTVLADADRSFIAHPGRPGQPERQVGIHMVTAGVQALLPYRAEDSSYPIPGTITTS